MAGDPTPPAEPTPPAPPPVPGGSLIDKLAPHALYILIGAGIGGVIALLLPAASAFGISGGGWINAWQGMLSLFGYIAVGVMAGLMLQKELPYARQLVLASSITAGVVLLLALWMFLSVATTSGVSMGIGTILNFLAALVLGAGAFIQAKKVKLF